MKRKIIFHNAVLAGAATLISAPLWAQKAMPDACGGDPHLLCGPTNAEDLVKLDDTWVLSSRIGGPGDTEGMFYLINSANRMWQPVGPDDMETAADATFSDCPGKPSSADFRGHGMTLDTSGETPRLYAINHGGRETVEVIDIALSDGAAPTLTWAGCIVAPEGSNLNAVAVLPEGGIATTKFTDTRNEKWVEDLLGVNDTGYVYEWHADAGWSEVEGTTMSGPNGVLVSPEGDAYYVAEWAARRLHRIPRGEGSSVEPMVIDTGVLTDNLHWAENGEILATGQWVAETVEYAGCMGSPAPACPVPFKVLRIDPESMEMTEVISYDDEDFGSGTTAVEVGDAYWIGTTRFDRIGTISAE
ncbi:hypothetical protein GQE99_01360 [Maritimibacter sp. DP07]|uniref:SMP-30/Gluconolactonase/LRE-like region domain-containing protein n=1 Tax=Maritimibacter harenae TaxID=2606218 RepID=A0A845M694_9RHOB|nr:hypothetical protein [Maritimibacter harenae]MZR11671.1 hypothetical protein [Maritimibacter harenae]